MTRGVYGNIDGHDIRMRFSEKYRFKCEEVEVLMKHIGGYPGRYDASIRASLFARPPKLFISGHSHILKVQYDKTLDCLHINPGAAGLYGFHKLSKNGRTFGRVYHCKSASPHLSAHKPLEPCNARGVRPESEQFSSCPRSLHPSSPPPI